MSDEQEPGTHTTATVYVENRLLPTTIKVSVGDIVFADGNGNVVKTQPEQPLVGTFTVPLTEADASAWFGPSVMVVSPSVMERLQAGLDAANREADRVREANADARRLHRERVLDRLYGLCGSTYERPCAACDDLGPWFVCLGCSTGMPRNGTWRISPGAAALIRAKAYARRNEPALPLPGGER